MVDYLFNGWTELIHCIIHVLSDLKRKMKVGKRMQSIIGWFAGNNMNIKKIIAGHKYSSEAFAITPIIMIHEQYKEKFVAYIITTLFKQ